MHSSGSLPPIEGLLAVAVANRTGSFTSAADQLGLTHGTISRRIRGVERWLGTALFERHGRGARPTPAGQRFIAQIEQALASIEQSADRWRPRQQLAAVRMSVLPSFAKLWLFERLRILQGEPQDVQIDLSIEHRLANVAGQEVDLAVRCSSTSTWRGLEARLLFNEQLFPVAAPSVAAKLGMQPSAARLAQEPLIHDSDTSHWRRWLAANAVKWRARSSDRRFEDYDLAVAAAAAGLGIALLRSPMSDAELSQGRLVRLSKNQVPSRLSHYLVLRAGEQRQDILRVASRLQAEVALTQRKSGSRAVRA